jgi:acid stress-induced BolA-like protein IbaG/YrbA
MVGHAQANRCGMSYEAIIVSADFEGKALLKRHRYEHGSFSIRRHLRSLFFHSHFPIISTTTRHFC